LAGKYTAAWQANNVTTGIFFVKLETEQYVGIRKVLLVK
jgi:hypothetical protein